MRVQRKRILAAALFLSIFLSAFLPFGTRAEGKGESTRTIRVGYIGHKSFIEKGNGGYYEGYGVAYLNRISQYTGWKYEYVYESWEEAMNCLEDGKIDLLCTAQKTPEREKRFLYSKEPLVSESTLIYAKKDTEDIYYRDYEKIDGAVVAMLAGGYQNERFARYAKEKGLHYQEKNYTTEEEVKKALESGEADLAVLGSLSRQDNLKIVDKLAREPAYFITSYNKKWLMQELDEAMAELKTTSPYLENQLNEEYYGDSVVNSEPLFTREEARYIAQAKPIRVVFRKDYYPLVYWNRDENRTDGILPELMHSVSKKSGLRMTFEMAENGNGADKLLKEDEDSLVVGDLYSQEYMENPKIQLTNSFFSANAMLVSQKEINVYEQIKPVIALPSIYKTAKSILPQWIQNCCLLYKNDPKDCIEAVENGQADASIQNMQTANYYTQMKSYQDLAVSTLQGMGEEYCIFLSADNDKMLRDILDKTVSCLDDTAMNQTAALYTAYQQEEISLKDLLWEYKAYLLLGLFVVVNVIVFAVMMSRRHMRILVEQKEKEAYRVKAETDELTGLWNRKAFYQNAEREMTEYPQRLYEILFFNIEKFKIVNDLFGVEEGDQVLKLFAELILRNMDGSGALCSRFDGDHFVCFVEKGRVNVEQVLEKIRQGLSAYPLNIVIEISCGVYVPEQTGRKEIEIMCDRAHLAADSIKGSHLHGVAYYNDYHRQKLIQEQVILNEMDAALANKQFHVYLQPKYDVETGSMIGAEALVRWQHPVRGVISPGEFIPVFEHNGFIAQLDSYMFEEVCRLMQKWKQDGKEIVPVSVNLSRMSFFDPKLCERLCAVVSHYGLETSMLELEVTETAYALDTDMMNEILTGLQAKGFRILMDDFGSGYSSLNMLKEAPIDEIKLDMRFLSEEDPYGRAAKILEMVIAMGNSLSITVLAEGVETGQQVEMLKSFKCRRAQGYFYARPEAEEVFEQRLE